MNRLTSGTKAQNLYIVSPSCVDMTLLEIMKTGEPFGNVFSSNPETTTVSISPTSLDITLTRNVAGTWYHTTSPGTTAFQDNSLNLTTCICFGSYKNILVFV